MKCFASTETSRVNILGEGDNLDVKWFLLNISSGRGQFVHFGEGFCIKPPELFINHYKTNMALVLFHCPFFLAIKKDKFIAVGKFWSVY